MTLLTGLGVVLSAPDVVLADIYKYVDEKGAVYYTDRPKHSGYRRVARAQDSGGSGNESRMLQAYRDLPPLDQWSGSVREPSLSERILNPVAAGIYSAQPSAPPAFRRVPADARLHAMISQIAGKYALDAALLHAVIHVESAFNPGAVSSKGAAGLMQLMPATAARYGVSDRFDSWQSLDGGARYLRDLMQLFDQRMPLVLAAYNAGEQTVIRNGYRIPAIPETQDYVTKVMQHYYQHLP